MHDRYNLNRFVEAQNPVYAGVFAELRQGRKTGHWMWYVFPQIEGLGYSDMARRFAISSLAEAIAYLEHPLLGLRLRECTQLVSHVKDRTIHEIFGSPDELKFRSCMTLFAAAATAPNVFEDALGKFFSGERDALTLQRIRD